MSAYVALFVFTIVYLLSSINLCRSCPNIK